MKVKVILKEDIKGVGKKNEIVEVKDGYANNFLLNNNKGILATTENLNKLKSKNEKTQKHKEKERENALVIKEKLDKKEIVLKVKAGENGKVFGSVGTKEIIDEIKNKFGTEIDRKKISTESRMKELGTHKVILKLHSEVKAEITVKLISGE